VSRRDAEAYPLLEEPFYGWTRDGTTAYHPTAREVLRDVMNSVDPRRGITRVAPFATALFYVATAMAAVVYLARGPRPATLLFIVGVVTFVSIVYNTVWFHRYCSHGAFRFKRPWARQIFLFTNPTFFREESYALPHRVHHARSDEPGDPYGPHLGRLGTLLAIETSQRTNLRIPPWRYRTLCRLLAHVGIPMNSYEEFLRTGSVEPVGHFLFRAMFAQAFYALVMYAIGGGELVVAWYGGLFFFLTQLRDFNWRGHGGARSREAAPNRPGPTTARNQAFYGLFAGEWHGNHHLCPRSARAGDGPWQVDLAFTVIRALYRIGLVGSYREELPPRASQRMA
jgi:stearoyl-CoA desaturase (delta-9 desaturase)